MLLVEHCLLVQILLNYIFLDNCEAITHNVCYYILSFGSYGCLEPALLFQMSVYKVDLTGFCLKSEKITGNNNVKLISSEKNC